MNILQIIYNILVKDLGLVKNVSNSSRDKNTSQLYPELFALLTSFFPRREKDKFMTNSMSCINSSSGKNTSVCFTNSNKLLNECNKTFFIYFSEKILKLLVENVVNIPSSNTMVSLANLIEIYIMNSPSECISTFIDPQRLSNIAEKMLDSKDTSYILQVFNLVEIIMQKVAEKYFVHFIREGVVDNIKLLIDAEGLHVSHDTRFLNSSSNWSDDSNEIDC
jgi:hypothetical protein